MYLLRILIAVSLVLALPLKSTAALWAWGCGPAHHSPLATQALHGHEPATTMAVIADSLPQPVAHRSHGPEAAVTAEHATLDVDDDPGQAVGAHADRCSACTPCGVALAPSPEGGIPPLAPPTAVLCAEQDAGHANGHFDVPLEPPRRSLA
jgi:hypothetical protein